MKKEKYESIISEAYEVFERKNSLYGDSYKELGLLGLLIMLRSKLGRIRGNIENERFLSLVKPDYATKKLRSDLLDIINYSIMAIEMFDETDEEEGER